MAPIDSSKYSIIIISCNRQAFSSFKRFFEVFNCHFILSHL